MRFFIALEIPDNSKKQLLEVQNQLTKILPDIRLTDIKKLHLTIAFMGEQPEQLKERLVEIIKDAVKNIPAFEVTPAYLDGFPNLHHPKIIWVGVKGDIDKLLLLEERVKDGLANLNLSVDERRFIPHIAVAKSKDLQINQSQEQALQKIMSQSFESIKVFSIKLFESIPEMGFHTHNTLAEIMLD